jgi:hypothetical protein
LIKHNSKQNLQDGVMNWNVVAPGTVAILGCLCGPRNIQLPRGRVERAGSWRGLAADAATKPRLLRRIVADMMRQLLAACVWAISTADAIANPRSGLVSVTFAAKVRA